ncbi:MAG: hypothetical protein WAK20_15895 [Candidatus Acidiferrum sp.]
MNISVQLFWLVILAIPIASIAWTITHEEIFREFREWCTVNSKAHKNFIARKAFYMLTCEYCFSHYVTLVFLLITRFKLLFDDWRGYLVSGFALVWLANVYINLYGRIRLDIKREQIEISAIRDGVRDEKVERSKEYVHAP